MRELHLQRALRLSAISVGLSAALGGTAVVVALATGSLSLLGFGADAAIDSVASVVLIWRFRVEAREPHRAERVERLAETAIGGVLLALALYLAVGALGALMTGDHPEVTTVGLALLGVSLVALPPLALAKRRAAAALHSPALRADSVLTGIAALLAAISFVGLGLSQAIGLTWADAVGALIVAGIVVREGWSAIQAIRRPDPLVGD